MGAIVDILHLVQEEFCIVKNRYPDCLVSSRTSSCNVIQRYRVIIPHEIEDSYYVFLLENCIAMSSANFINRIGSDKKFAERMKSRIAKAIEKGSTKIEDSLGEMSDLVKKCGLQGDSP